MKTKHIEALTEIVDGKLVAIASDESIDRVGDSLKVDDWDLKNFKKNPVLQAGHDYRPQFTIGIAKNMRVEGKKLIFEPIFHKFTELARNIEAMFTSKPQILKAWSVGFIPAREDGQKNELLEVSAVAVPANASALTSLKSLEKSAENLDEVEEKELGEKVNKWIEEKGCCGDSKTNTDALPKKEEEEEPKETIKKPKKLSKEKKPKEKIVKKFIRWNKSLSKAFDVDSVEMPPSTFEYSLFTKFLDCKVKEIFKNGFLIPSPLLGSYLASLKNIFSDFKLKDTRNFEWNGTESPPIYEVIKLNSKKSDDFLVEGVNFYENKDGDGIAVKVSPTWFGLKVNIVTTLKDKDYNKGLLKDVHNWVKENNYLKGEKFSLRGEFIDNTKKDWDDVILDDDIKNSIKKSVSQLNKNKSESSNRGMLFLGEPGTGKTMSGKVMMDKADSTFVWVSSKDFYKIGVVEALALSFKLARDLAPSILFIEDIDTWLKGSAVDLLKTEMDGISENKGMLTVLTTNFPEQLPKALLDRPGRFHDVLDFKAPNRKIRKDMINKWAGKIDKKLLKNILDKTKGYTGAYIKELVDFAKMIVEDDEIEIGDALLKSLDKIEKQRELVNSISSEVTKSVIIDIEEKVGRVISKKNKIIITKAVEALNNAAIALEKLLDLSETPEGDKTIPTPVKAKENGEVKGREPKKVVKQKLVEANDIVLRALKTIAKNSNFALNKLNRK